MRAGSLRQKLETSSAVAGRRRRPTSSSASATRRGADVVRVLWPAGIVQAELPPAADAPAAGVVPHATLALTELDRKPSSCPYLFTWNGERFEFITDFMGGGEMGYQHAPGVVGHPDPEEYVRIDGDRAWCRATAATSCASPTSSRRRCSSIRLRLIAVDHPATVEVHPREGAFSPPFPGFQLYAAADARPVAARDRRRRPRRDRAAAAPPIASSWTACRSSASAATRSRTR